MPAALHLLGGKCKAAGIFLLLLELLRCRSNLIDIVFLSIEYFKAKGTRIMKKYLSLLIISLSFTALFIGCKPEYSSTKNGQDVKQPVAADTKESSQNVSGITLEKIKEKYTNENLGKIVKTYDYSNYILVEYLNTANIQCFDLYNLKTGDRDVILMESTAKVFNFSSGDRIVFESDGTNQANGHKYFPCYITCYRAEEVTGNENDFYMKSSDLYRPIGEKVEFGVKDNEMISDLKITLTGFELQFSAQKGKEGSFYADYTTIPVIKTSCGQNKNQFLLELFNTSVSPELLKKAFKEQNRYIDSLEVKEKGSNSMIVINLKDTGKFYTAKFEHGENDDFPSVRFIFRSSNVE